EDGDRAHHPEVEVPRDERPGQGSGRQGGRLEGEDRRGGEEGGGGALRDGGGERRRREERRQLEGRQEGQSREPGDGFLEDVRHEGRREGRREGRGQGGAGGQGERRSRRRPRSAGRRRRGLLQGEDQGLE